MVNLTYAEMNKKYREDVKGNNVYLIEEIPLGIILPHLREVLHPADHETLRKQIGHKSNYECNQDLLDCLVKREYWWRDFRQALVSIPRNDIIERLGWDEETFDFKPKPPVVKNPTKKNKKSSIKEDGEYFESAEQFTMIEQAASDPCLNFDPSNGCSNAERPEIVIQEENSKMCKMENNDTLKPMSSRSQNLATAISEVPAENPACQSNMASSTTDVIQPSIASTVDPTGISRNNNMRYFTHLHGTGSDITSSISSGSVLSKEVLDQTYFDSVTRVDALDDWNLDLASIQSDHSNNSSSQTPDAMRLDAPSAAGDVTTAPPVVENLNLSNSGLAQNPSSAQSEGTSVDPVDISEPGAGLVSVAYPPSTGQLAGIERESLNQSQEQEGVANNANSTCHVTAHNEAPPSFLRKLYNTVSHAFESIFE